MLGQYLPIKSASQRELPGGTNHGTAPGILAPFFRKHSLYLTIHEVASQLLPEKAAFVPSLSGAATMLDS